MDGIRYVRSMSRKTIVRKVSGLPLFGEKDKIEKDECPGCEINDSLLHTGEYVKIKDWSRGKNGVKIEFRSLLDPQDSSPPANKKSTPKSPKFEENK